MGKKELLGLWVLWMHQVKVPLNRKLDGLIFLVAVTEKVFIFVQEFFMGLGLHLFFRSYYYGVFCIICITSDEFDEGSWLRF